MAHKRLVFAVYASVVVCVWWLLGHAQSVMGWLLALLIVALGLSADYVITETPGLPSRLASRWKQLTKMKATQLFTRHPGGRRGPA